MGSMITSPAPPEVQIWPIDRLVFYARNPRKNDPAVDRMCASIREFGFKIPVLARSDGTVVDGHLRLKSCRKLGISEVPVILCDEWTEAQVKAFRLLVNRSVAWAAWDDELLGLELQDTQRRGFRSQPHRIRSEGNRRPAASARGRRGCQCRTAC